MNFRKDKAVIAVSGGVDSSVASLLLLEQGYDVVGLTAVMSDSSYKAVDDAAKACEKFGIRHEVLDLREEFADSVIKYFEQSYMDGLTPNPCVFCNKIIKWGKMTEYAFGELRADVYATGHYARIIDNRLYRGKDLKKDQSYMLFNLTQEDLARTIFPLGGLDKSEVRQIAEKNGLVCANSKESQDVCFIVPPETNQTYLTGKFGEKPGEIIEYRTGKVLGTHRGTFNYTIGQRRGICVSGPEPYYVVGLDAKNNIVVVGHKQYLFSSEFQVNNINWQQEFAERVMVKIRYNSPAQEAVITKEGYVRLKEPKSAITPGQAAVFYDINNEYVLGGGVIS